MTPVGVQTAHPNICEICAPICVICGKYHGKQPFGLQPAHPAFNQPKALTSEALTSEALTSHRL